MAYCTVAGALKIQWAPDFLRQKARCPCRRQLWAVLVLLQRCMDYICTGALLLRKLSQCHGDAQHVAFASVAVLGPCARVRRNHPGPPRGGRNHPRRIPRQKTRRRHRRRYRRRRSRARARHYRSRAFVPMGQPKTTTTRTPRPRALTHQRVALLLCAPKFPRDGCLLRFDSVHQGVAPLFGAEFFVIARTGRMEYKLF